MSWRRRVGSPRGSHTISDGVDLPLVESVCFGVSTSFPDPEAPRSIVRRVDDPGFESVRVGDHIELNTPRLDSIVQRSLAAALPAVAAGAGVQRSPSRIRRRDVA